jgi:hypothetical protein
MTAIRPLFYFEPAQMRRNLLFAATVRTSQLRDMVDPGNPPPPACDPCAAPIGDPLCDPEGKTISEPALPVLNGLASPHAVFRSTPLLTNLPAQSEARRARWPSADEHRQDGASETTEPSPDPAARSPTAPDHDMADVVADGPPCPSSAPPGARRRVSSAADESMAEKQNPPDSPAPEPDTPTRGPSLGTLPIKAGPLPLPLRSPTIRPSAPPENHGELAHHLLQGGLSQQERKFFDSADYVLELEAIRVGNTATAV